MQYKIDVFVTAPVMETEIDERVLQAVRSIFPEADPVIEPGASRVTGEARSLDTFAEKIREQRILDTVRGHLFDQQRGKAIEFDLKKQAAFRGIVNFSVGKSDELGEIHVEVHIEDPSVEEFIEYLAPATDEEGRPIEDPMS
ncbi:MAG: RNA-binding domain-containing protein [Halobacteriaceae archaeon]